MATREFADLKQDVKDKTGNQRAADGQLGVALNRGYHRLITKVINLDGKYYLTKANLSITAGDTFVDLPEDYLKHFLLLNPDGIEVQELDPKDDEFYQREASTVEDVASVAIKFTPAGYNTTTGRQRIYLSPAAGATETWTLWYNFMPARLSADDDTPLIPEIFEEPLVLFAVADIYENQQNRSMASYFLNRGAGQLRDMMSDIKNRSSRKNPAIVRQRR